MYNRAKIAYVRDLLISKTTKIADNLVCNPNKPEGVLTMNFLLLADEELLKEIKSICGKHYGKDIELWFSEQEGPDKLAKRLPYNAKYQDYQIFDVRIGKDVNGYIHHADEPPIWYLDVVFLKYDV